MKKFTWILVLVLAVFSFCAFGCSKKNDNVVRVSEVTHSLFYAPFYVAINNGYFEDEGIEIELTNAMGSDTVMTSLTSNSADVGLLGPEAVVYVRNQGMTNAPIIFAQLTNCDGSFLMGRTELDDEEEFDWTSLRGKHVIAGRRGGMPAMTLQYILERYGLKLGDELGADVDTIFDLSVSFSMTAVTFLASQGDYVTMFEPTASECNTAGTAFIQASLGEEEPNVPYTVFTATSSFLQKNPQKVQKFVNALENAYNYLMDEDRTDQEIITCLKPSFNTTSDALILSAVKNYMRIGAYASNFALSEASWNKLLDIIDNAGLLTNNIAHTTAVNNTFVA